LLTGRGGSSGRVTTKSIRSSPRSAWRRATPRARAAAKSQPDGRGQLRQCWAGACCRSWRPDRLRCFDRRA
jgi:hypothetical protein